MTACTIDHLGLVVADLETMTAWWSATLGAEVEYAVERPAVPMQARTLRSPDGFRLELLHRTGSSPAHDRWDVDESLLSQGYGHLALRTDDVAALHDRLVAHGATSVRGPGPGSRPGLTVAFVADPENNLVELISRAPAGAVDGE